MNRKPRYVTLRFRGYLVSARILPARAESHDGPDSPHYLDPGHPARLESFRVLSNRMDVTDDLAPAERAAIERYVCQCAGIPVSEPAEPSLSTSRPALSVRESGQHYIDWRGRLT